MAYRPFTEEERLDDILSKMKVSQRGYDVWLRNLSIATCIGSIALLIFAIAPNGFF